MHSEPDAAVGGHPEWPDTQLELGVLQWPPAPLSAIEADEVDVDGILVQVGTPEESAPERAVRTEAHLWGAPLDAHRLPQAIDEPHDVAAAETPVPEGPDVVAAGDVQAPDEGVIGEHLPAVGEVAEDQPVLQVLPRRPDGAVRCHLHGPDIAPLHVDRPLLAIEGLERPSLHPDGAIRRDLEVADLGFLRRPAVALATEVERYGREEINGAVNRELYFARLEITRGDTDAAIRHLQDAVDNGWVGSFTWTLPLREDPFWGPLTDRPEVAEIADRLDAEIAVQRAAVVGQLEQRGVGSRF